MKSANKTYNYTTILAYNPIYDIIITAYQNKGKGKQQPDQPVLPHLHTPPLYPPLPFLCINSVTYRILEDQLQSDT
jgi:hypothetical protein